MKKKLMSFGFMAMLSAWWSCSSLAITVTFTAQDVKEAMNIPLHDASYQWGIWAVRVRPVVTGGDYEVTGTSGMTTQEGWGATVPSDYDWSGYGKNIAWFWDESGAEVGKPANPLYMIIDKPANTFESYFGNTVTAVDDSSLFQFSFTLGDGAIWTGDVEFLVDGSKYNAGTETSPGEWVQNLFGNYGDGGGLTGNMGSGYRMHVPDCGSTALLLGSVLGGLASLGRRFRR